MRLDIDVEEITVLLAEIFYRVLRGRQGARLLEIAIPDSQIQCVHLSPSTLHQRFKAVTAMSPLQYQKQLRLLISEHSDVSSTSYRMGYESPSRFCREYSRLFGALPLKDVARLKQRNANPSVV